MLDLFRLEDVVEQLRVELRALQRKADDDKETLRFAVTDVEVEFQVVVTTSGTAGGKVELKVLGSGLEFGGEGAVERARTQTLRLKLTPRVVDPESTESAESGEVLMGR